MSDEAYIVMSYIVLIVFIIVIILICAFKVWEKKSLAKIRHKPLDEIEKTKRNRSALKRSLSYNDGNKSRMPKLSSDYLATAKKVSSTPRLGLHIGSQGED